MITTPETFDKAKFKQQFYPANPFANGVVIEASQVPVEVFKECFQADLALEALNVSERCVIPGMVIFVQIDGNWLKALLQRKRIIYSYVATVLQGSPEARHRHRQQILEIDNPQLHQDLIEADEALDFIPGVY